MKELMWIMGMIPVCIIAFILFRVWRRRRKEKLYDAITPQALIFPYDTGYYPPREYMKILAKEDHTVSKRLRKHCAPKLARNDVEAINNYMSNKETPGYDLDPIRMINAKASLYKLQIPEAALFIDERTSSFLTFMMNLLEPLTPIANVHDKVYKEHTPPEDQIFRTYGNKFVVDATMTFLWRNDEEQAKPFNLIEWVIARKQIGGAIKAMGLIPRMVKPDVIRSTLTAYAIHNGIKIPRDYIRYDEVTIHFLNTLKAEVEKKPTSHLRLVERN